MVIALENLKKEGIPYKIRNIVHDEMVISVPNDLTIAKRTVTITEQAITQAGLDLNLKCPMSGVGAIGKNWLEVH